MTLSDLKKAKYVFKINSNEIEKNDVFVAYGKGHNYVNDAFSKGASFAVIDTEGKYIGKTIKLNNTTLDFLNESAKILNSKMTIAITGSNGKTTTKECLYYLLSPHMKTFKTPKNKNTEIGIPLSIFNEYNNEDVAILEMGLRKPGDLELLSNVYKPDVVFITNIGSSHMEFFKNKEMLSKEKMKITSGMDRGLLILNGDQNLKNIAPKNLNILTFGKNENNDGYLKDFFYYKNNTKVFYTLFGKELMLTLNGIWTEGHLLDLLSAILFTVFIKVPLDPSVLSQINLPEGRFKLYELKNKTIIDDSYNASYESFTNGFKTLERLKGKKILIMGEVLESGDKKINEKILKETKNTFDEIYFFDPQNIFSSLKVKKIKSFEELKKLLNELKGIIYIKASNGTGINSFLKEYFNNRRQ
ncbi:UDP-N-acetylmuramoyl-tripeptide--D-alanyl-D-alanine ligase [Tepiditoga spiralis]|uniref:UDP-N-acetylmuramoyl-tripeptide--D-alanyl-D-alanine ligase n=1 Tax=Tepiditoga spiralis TaxID=2108365 RepID=A0A7G1G228_9BACT|nr:Mur ligase family protein [Tepiditoga spiralis]BBE30370.1 UDP-N-acetylmuramoyl-tripeptide--D-alanyl-D-alanine ligase [Tepiditoga spiralis]